MSSYPTWTREFQKNSKKIQKFKKNHYGSFSSQNGTGLASKEKKKFIVPISYYPTRNRKLKKKQQKNSKIEKHHYIFILNSKRFGSGREREQKKLSFRSVTTQPGIENLKKNSKKIQKFKKHHYGSFAIQNGTGLAEKEKRNYCSDQLLPDQEQKIAKKFKKLKNIIISSFQVKTVREWPRKSEKKKLSFRSVPKRPGTEN